MNNLQCRFSMYLSMKRCSSSSELLGLLCRLQWFEQELNGFLPLSQPRESWPVKENGHILSTNWKRFPLFQLNVRLMIKLAELRSLQEQRYKLPKVDLKWLLTSVTPYKSTTWSIVPTACAGDTGYFYHPTASVGATGAAHCGNTGSAHQGGGLDAAKTNDTLVVCPSKQRVKRI